LIHGLTKAGLARETSSIFHAMKQQGFALDARAYNAVVDGFCKSGKVDKAYEVLEEMKVKRVPPTVATYGSIIDGLAKIDRLDEAYMLFEEAKSKGIELNVIVYSSLIDGFGKVGRIDEAYLILEEMMKKGLTPNVYNVRQGEIPRSPRRWAEAYRGAYGGRRTSRRSARLRGVPRRLRGAWAASRRTRRRLGGSARARDSVFAGGSAHARERATARERKRLRGKEKSRAPVPIERIRERQRHREREENRRRRSSLLSAAGLHLSCRPPPVAPARAVCACVLYFCVLRTELCVVLSYWSAMHLIFFAATVIPTCLCSEMAFLCC